MNEKLTADGIEARIFHSSLLVEPEALLNQSGKPYRVYSAFRRRVLRDIHPPQVVHVSAEDHGAPQMAPIGCAAVLAADADG